MLIFWKGMRSAAAGWACGKEAAAADTGGGAEPRSCRQVAECCLWGAAPQIPCPLAAAPWDPAPRREHARLCWSCLQLRIAVRHGTVSCRGRRAQGEGVWGVGLRNHLRGDVSATRQAKVASFWQRFSDIWHCLCLKTNPVHCFTNRGPCQEQCCGLG